MENPITLIEGLPLWGKILLGVIALILLLLVWKPWSSGAATAATTAATTTALPNTLAPGQQDEIVSNPLPASPSVPVSSAASTALTPQATLLAEKVSGAGYYQPGLDPGTDAITVAGGTFGGFPSLAAAQAYGAAGNALYYQPSPGQFTEISSAGSVPGGTPLYMEEAVDSPLVGAGAA